MKKITILIFAIAIVLLIGALYSKSDQTPDQIFFTGTLRQDATGFSLIMDSAQFYEKAPDRLGQGQVGEDVAYVLPLSIKVTNVLGEFVGKNVRVDGTLDADNVFVVDQLEVLVGDAADPTLGTVGVGKSVFINGIRITLNSVVQDSRCPIDVQCIQAGAINTNVTFQSDTDTETRNMPSDEVPLSFDSYKISIEAINPPRYSGRETEQNEYLITFKVVPAI